MQAPHLSSKAFCLAAGILLLWAGGILGAHRALAAPRPAGFSDLKAEYIFGEAIVFSARVQSEAAVQKVEVFFQSAGESETIIGQAFVDENGLALYTHDLISQPVRSFTQISYWFLATLQNGATLQSEPASFYYQDTRFAWQSLENDSFRVHWYEGETAFGQDLLNTAQAGLERVQALLPITPTAPVDVYVYASALEMQSTLQMGNIHWVRGHATPDLGVMVVSLPRGPDQRIEMQRQIPHELMHILLYQWLGEGYNNLPVWLNEGLASLAELSPNPDYATMLKLAHEKDTLLPLASLCETIPVDASGAFLAYAEADGFTRFLRDQFGSAGLRAVVAAYADGMNCTRGVEVGVNQSLERLEGEWLRETFGISVTASILANLLPWVGVMLATLAVPLLTAISLGRRRPSAPRPANPLASPGISGKKGGGSQ